MGDAASSSRRALLIGNSDGIGRETTRQLLRAGWGVQGISRSSAELDGDYGHEVADVTSPDYAELVEELWRTRGPFDVCLYCVGIGEPLRPDLADELRVFDANLMGLVRTAQAALPRMIERRSGHFLGLSSLADEGFFADAPSYCASKAGFSNYLKSLAPKMREHGVHVTNIRFGFVDTKMAKARKKPLMIPPEKAARLVLRCLDRKPIQFSYPKTAAALVQALRLAQGARVWLG